MVSMYITLAWLMIIVTLFLALGAWSYWSEPPEPAKAIFCGLLATALLLLAGVFFVRAQNEQKKIKAAMLEVEDTVIHEDLLDVKSRQLP